MRTLLARLLCLAFISLGGLPALAADTYFGTPGGGGVNGAVGMCINAAGFAVPCSDPTSVTAPSTGITPADHTITSASGASQQIMAANTTRHSLTIANTGNSNCGVNPRGGTAVIGGAGTITLIPNGSYAPRVPTLSAVTVICAAGQPIYADDN